jgi:hypothetical protein
MREHTSWPQPLAPAPQPQTPEHHPCLQTPETQSLSGLEHLGIVRQQIRCQLVPTLREAEEAGNTEDMDVDQQLLTESPGGDSLPDVPLPDVPLPDVSLHDIPPSMSISLRHGGMDW